MSKIIRIDRDKLPKSEDTQVDEMFDEIIEKNKAIKEKLAKERAEKNKKVLREYRIKRKDDK